MSLARHYELPPEVRAKSIRRRIRIFGIFFATILSLLLASILGVYLFQKKLVYRNWNRGPVFTPDQYAFYQYEELQLNSRDGERLQAYWIPLQSPIRPPSLITYLIFHGNSGNLGHRLSVLRGFYDSGVPGNALLMSYRGFGESSGSPDEAGIKQDAQAALDYILTVRHREIDPTKIIVHGFSLGGAVTIDLASRNLHRIWALIVENSFLSIPKVVEKFLGPLHRLCTEIWNSEQRVLEALEHVRSHPGTLFPNTLLLVGARDQVIPPYHMRQLYQHMRSHDAERVRLIEFPLGDHRTTRRQPDYYSSCADFIRSLPHSPPVSS